MDKHVVRHGEDVAVYTHSAGQDHLKDGHRAKRKIHECTCSTWTAHCESQSPVTTVKSQSDNLFQDTGDSNISQ